METNTTVLERVEIFCQNVNETLDNFTSLTNNEKEIFLRNFSTEFKELSNLLKMGDKMLEYNKYFKLLPMLLKAKLTNEQWAYIYMCEKLIAKRKEENNELEKELWL